MSATHRHRVPLPAIGCQPASQCEAAVIQIAKLHSQLAAGRTDTGRIGRHNSLTRPQVRQACKHIAKREACTCSFTSFAAGGARCTSSQDQPDISAGRRQRGTAVHETEDTQKLKRITRHTHHILASSCLSSRQIASHTPLVDWGAKCKHTSHN